MKLRKTLVSLHELNLLFYKCLQSGTTTPRHGLDELMDEDNRTKTFVLLAASIRAFRVNN
jgi:hypothetical protein